MKSSNSISTNSKSKEDYKDIWNCNCLIDKILNDLMDDKKADKYIKQFIDKFHYFRIKSPNTIFFICLKDLDKYTTIIQLESFVKDCKTSDEKRIRLDGIFTEVISRVAKQARPLILSNIKYEDIDHTKTALNEIREIISLKWDLVN
jgi:hypothetical protein